VWGVDIDEQAVLLPWHLLLFRVSIPLHAPRHWLRGVQHPIPLAQGLRAL
jgi:hypothetical protein